jgi:hypothetical protein
VKRELRKIVYILKKFRDLFLCLAFVSSVPAQDISYGSSIESIILKDCIGRNVVLPAKNSVTVLLFFNINNPLHLSYLSELNYLYENLSAAKGKVTMAAITKGDDKTLLALSEKYSAEFLFINDKETSLSKRYQANCGGCSKLVLVDKSSKVRYSTSQFDLLFLREIINRYISKVQ